jgi:hypothetical protein
MAQRSTKDMLAFSFDGVSALVNVPDSQSLDMPNGSSWTIQAWAFRTNSSSPQHLAGKREGCSGGDDFYQLAIGVNAIPPSSAPVNSWAHLAITVDGQTGLQTSYVNGAVVSTFSAPGWKIENTAPFLIGGSGSCAGFPGLIDEVSLYNRALSADEIQAIYAAGQAGQCLPPPVVHGQVTGLTSPSSGQVDCNNLTTGQSVTIMLPDGIRNWACEAGFVVNEGDQVQINAGITGQAESSPALNARYAPRRSRR